MVTVYDARPDALLSTLSEELRNDKNLEPPAWSTFAKTGSHKERVPDDPCWWHTRAASVLRRIYIDGPVGVERLRTFYGGRKGRGHKPQVSAKAGGKILRTILQQLERAGLVAAKQSKGRVLTPKGQKLCDDAAMKVVKGG